MLSISNPKRGGSGGGYYFEYYSSHAEQEQSRCLGNGAARLGATGEVTRKVFENLLEGRSPDGKIKLVQNAGAEKRQGFWDLTFSAPKSVSVLYMAAAAGVRKEVEKAVQSAVQSSLSYLEAECGFTRRGKGGKILEKSDLAFATFFHYASRANEPQLHMHCLLLNVGVRSDGTTGALQSVPIFRSKMAAGAIFQAQLASELSKRLQLEIEPEANGFHVKGVPRELCEECSSRRKDIKSELKKRGVSDAVSAKAAALKTRGKKEFTSVEKLSELWTAIAAKHGWSEEKAAALVKRKPMDTERERRGLDNFKRAFSEELSKLFPQNQTRARAVRVAAKVALAHGVDAGAVLDAVNRAPLPTFRQGYRIERRPLFPKAPAWSPAQKLRLPVIAVRDRPCKWGGVEWKKPLWSAGRRELEFRIQERRLFPKAPKWSPFHNLSLPALRVAPAQRGFAVREKERERGR